MAESLPRRRFDELPPELAELLRPRVERLGYLGEFFQCMALQPDALAAFVSYTEHAKAALDKRVVEVIALTAATELGNDYERNQHERLCVRLGLGRDWVFEVERRDPDGAQLMDPQDRLVQRFVLRAVRTHGRDAGGVFAELLEALGPVQATAVLMVVGRYVAHATMVNTLGLAPPVPSIAEDGFDGD